MPQLEYRIDVSKACRRELLVQVSLTDLGAGDRVEFFLPTWTPGSYLIREYSRHLSRVRATEVGSGRELKCHKTRKNRFVVHRDGADGVALQYRVYAHELSVRTAHADDSRAYWTPTCVLLWPVGATELAAEVVVEHPVDWSVHCSLPADAPAPLAPDRRETRLRARDLDEALDAPVLVGRPDVHEWLVDGVRHRIALDGLGPIAPPPTLTSDLERIVRAARDVFGGPLPYPDYLFQALFTDDGYGGLEHRDSSTLLMARTSLAEDRSYRQFLALAAHELFHAWNVKRMRPVELWQPDYEAENYTRMLWLMEGWTAYYDDLLVVRAGLMSHDDYLATMAKNVQALQSSPGRFELSLEESSFDAWIRLYRPDENTRNSSQNYYGNGAVAALCLDLTIRRDSAWTRSLDDVLRDLYGATFGQQRGYVLDDVHRAVAAAGGDAAVALLRRLVEGPLDPELEELLVGVGVQLSSKGEDKPFLGVTFQPGTTRVASVVRDGPAHAGGVAPGDEVLAVQSARTTPENWRAVFAAAARCGEPVELLVARRGMVRTLQAIPTASPGSVVLRCRDDAAPPQVAAREAWLGAGAS